MNERRPIRLVAGALAALWLALPVATAVHGTLEAHEFCAEHQSFEHVSDRGSSASYDGDAISTTVSPDVHEDCSFDDALLRTARTVRQLPVVTAVAAQDICVPVCAPVEHVAAAVLSTAPKTSPPTLAA